jgi:putative transposase
LEVVKYDPAKHHRRSIRLPGYDYTQNGAYFVTICTWQRQHLFGEVIDGTMHVGELGSIVEFHWHKLVKYHQHLELDAFVVMPNHVHGILVLMENGRSSKRQSLSEIIRGFKTFSSRQINKYRDWAGVPVWQRGYYEHIIRNGDAWQNIRNYIFNNPSNWMHDELHPDVIGKWKGKMDMNEK